MQKAFADYYIETANATESAKRAGYSEKTARSQGQRLLTNVDISAYIRERLDEQSDKRVADANEVIEFYTAVMRGEVKDQFGLDASLSDRLKAGDALMKRYAVTDNGSKGIIEKLDKVLGDIDEVMNNGET
jgi:phage terminase small subunit